MKIWIINFIIVAFCLPLGAQKMTKSERIKKETQLLEAYKNLDRSQQIDVCKELTGTWFDTVKYNVKMVHNQEGDPYEYKKLNIRIASVIEDKTDRYNKKILFFEPENGKIAKVIDFKKQNPYSKSKEPRLDEKLKYTSEYMDHIPLINENGKKHKISKFLSLDYGGWRGDYIVWCFRKLALSESEDVIDEWNTFIIFDSAGNTIMNHEFNEPSIRYEINCDGSYFLNEIAIEGWEKNGFIIYDIHKRREVYKYLDPIYDSNGEVNGVGFVHSNSDFVKADLTVPKTDSIAKEKIIIDLKQSIEYRRIFKKYEIKEIHKKWDNENYIDNLLKNFKFNIRKY